MIIDVQSKPDPDQSPIQMAPSALTGGLFAGSVYIGKLSLCWKDEFFTSAIQSFHKAFLEVESSGNRAVDTVLMSQRTWDTLLELDDNKSKSLKTDHLDYEGKKKFLWTARVKITDMDFGHYIIIPFGGDWYDN